MTATAAGGVAAAAVAACPTGATASPACLKDGAASPAVAVARLRGVAGSLAAGGAATLAAATALRRAAALGVSCSLAVAATSAGAAATPTAVTSAGAACRTGATASAAVAGAALLAGGSTRVRRQDMGAAARRGVAGEGTGAMGAGVAASAATQASPAGRGVVQAAPGMPLIDACMMLPHQFRVAPPPLALAAHEGAAAAPADPPLVTPCLCMACSLPWPANVSVAAPVFSHGAQPPLTANSRVRHITCWLPSSHGVQHALALAFSTQQQPLAHHVGGAARAA